jgi:hypothetical protein
MKRDDYLVHSNSYRFPRRGKMVAVRELDVVVPDYEEYIEQK